MMNRREPRETRLPGVTMRFGTNGDVSNSLPSGVQSKGLWFGKLSRNDSGLGSARASRAVFRALAEHLSVARPTAPYGLAIHVHINRRRRRLMHPGAGALPEINRVVPTETSWFLRSLR